MNEVAAGIEIGVLEATITTLSTAVAIGVAFLRKPGAATLYWSLASATAMVGIYCVVAGESNDMEIVRRVGLGALLGASGLLWSGFRAWWGLRRFGWAGVAVGLTAAIALALAPDQESFTIAFRAGFLVTTVFPLLFFFDWVRVPERRRDRLLLPLGIISLVYFAIGATTFVSALLSPAPGGPDFRFRTALTTIGMLLYIACAVVAVMGLPTRDGPGMRTATPSMPYQEFEAAASERLRRAQGSSHPWSVVFLRLDDAADLRQTVGATTFAALADALEHEVRAVFPAECEIASPTPGTVIATVPRSDAAVRDLLRAMLARVPDLDMAGALPVRPTISAGWASTSTLGYEFAALAYMAREAATLAQEKGGDRWERVGATVVRRLITP